jgi:hypothetical protein
LREGALSEGEALEVGRFYAQAQDINRGLDNAAALLQANDRDGLQRECDRNFLKAKRLVNDGESLYATAKRVTDAKLAQPWWRY